MEDIEIEKKTLLKTDIQILKSNINDFNTILYYIINDINLNDKELKIKIINDLNHIRSYSDIIWNILNKCNSLL